MFNMFKGRNDPAPEKKKPAPKAWLINPVTESVTEIDNPHMPSLIGEIGDDAEVYKLDNNNNVVWMTDTDSNLRYAYFWEGMCYPFSEKRYSKAIVESMGPNYWDIETIKDYLRFYDRKNVWGDI